MEKKEKIEEIDIYKVNTPIDVIKQSIGKEVYIKCKYNRELKGKLHVIIFNNKYNWYIYNIGLWYTFKFIIIWGWRNKYWEQRKKNHCQNQK